MKKVLNAPSVARVMFGQHGRDGVTASLRHTSGPLIVGETVVVYEVDDVTLWAWGEVVAFDSQRGVASIEVDWSTLKEVEKPVKAEGVSETEAAHVSVVERVKELAAA